jgi:hypothetical protein
MLNFAERTGCGAVIVVWSFLEILELLQFNNNLSHRKLFLHFRKAFLKAGETTAAIAVGHNKYRTNCTTTAAVDLHPIY